VKWLLLLQERIAELMLHDATSVLAGECDAIVAGCGLGATQAAVNALRQAIEALRKRPTSFVHPSARACDPECFNVDIADPLQRPDQAGQIEQHKVPWCFHTAPARTENRVTMTVDVGGFDPQLPARFQQPQASHQGLRWRVHVLDDMAQRDRVQIAQAVLGLFKPSLANFNALFACMRSSLGVGLQTQNMPSASRRVSQE
jgi:hypothetical protein